MLVGYPSVFLENHNNNLVSCRSRVLCSTVECHELGQKIRILGQGQEQDSSED